jgi:hypothetical protein
MSSRWQGKYVWVVSGGKSVLEHIYIAENAIGMKLPKGAQVHHVDLDGLNNKNTNLVICQSIGYHRLLHRRTEALNSCGNANWVKCKHCKAWGEPESMRLENASGRSLPITYHVQCNRDYQKSKYDPIRKKEQYLRYKT